MIESVPLSIKLLGGALLSCGMLATGIARAGTTPLTGINYYVASNGADSNPGTVEFPFKTIMRASKVAWPGSTVHVAAGTYAGGFQTTASGTADGRIYYVSTTPRGAKIVPPPASINNTAWDNRGNYVDIVGFDVDGTTYKGGEKWTHGIYSAGSYVTIRNNRVHHVAKDVPCTNVGGSGIGVDSYYRGVKSDIIDNTVHDIGPAGCSFVQGIYISTSARAHNNIVFAISGAAIQMWHDASNVTVSNNTVSGSVTGIIVGAGDFYHSKGPNDFTKVHNNIVYDNAYGISEQGKTGRNNSYRNNLVFQNSVADWQLLNGLKHSGTVNAAPQFLRYTKTGESDFRLHGTSPARRKGIDGTDLGATP